MAVTNRRIWRSPSLASAYANLPLPTTAVMIGEVGLAGDIRQVWDGAAP